MFTQGTWAPPQIKLIVPQGSFFTPLRTCMGFTFNLLFLEEDTSLRQLFNYFMDIFIDCLLERTIGKKIETWTFGLKGGPTSHFFFAIIM
jgi:hypothetical protein